MTQAGSIYGQALYELAAEEKTEELIKEQLLVLSESFRAEPDFLKLLSSPNISKQARCSILDDSFRGKIHSYLLNFMKILTEKGYIKSFPDCCDRFIQLYNDNHNILTVTAVTAVPMNDRQTDALRKKLGDITGKTVILHNRVEADCLGGVRLDYDGRRLDGTVRNQLAQIRDTLRGTIL